MSGGKLLERLVWAFQEELVPARSVPGSGPSLSLLQDADSSARRLPEQFSFHKASQGGLIGPFVSDKSQRGWEFNSLCQRLRAAPKPELK